MNKCKNKNVYRLEIDQYIGLPMFFPIFKHFTIIGYRLKKKKFVFVFVTQLYRV